MDALTNAPIIPLLGAALVVLAGVAVIAYVGRRPAGRVIKVVGVGSGGSNAVEAMIRARIRGVEFVVVNTDTRALRHSSARRKIQIGKPLTRGLGTGGDSAVGEKAARESAEEVARALAGSDLVVITAGLGGGVGSGATPVVADIARQTGALTMAVVTKPFTFEGARRRRVAEAAAGVLADKADAVATIPNDRVRDVIAADATVDDAFAAIDQVVSRSIGEVVNLIAVPGRINIDFSDVRAVLAGSGAAVMGVGRAAGDHRATEAARSAMAGTLLEGTIQGAASVLLSVSGSSKLKLAELDAVVRTVLASAGADANLVFGVGEQRNLGDEIQVTLVATGLGSNSPGGGRRHAEAQPAPAEEWRPVWLRRSAVPLNEASVSPTPRSPRKRATTPPKPAPGTADTTTGS